MVRERGSHVWDAMDRLHQKGYISDPKGKAKSVVMTDEGAKRAKELFEKHFRSSEFNELASSVFFAQGKPRVSCP
jgi:Mn-dependent DtxR family transcriptional regulator